MKVAVCLLFSLAVASAGNTAVARDDKDSFDISSINLDDHPELADLSEQDLQDLMDFTSVDDGSSATEIDNRKESADDRYIAYNLLHLGTHANATEWFPYKEYIVK